MSPDEFLRKLSADPTSRGEKHIVCPPVTDAELADWQKRHPDFRLPADLISFLRKANGIHPHTDTTHGEGYIGLAPLHRWDVARQVFWGKDTDADYPPDSFVAITYHQDGASYVVLDIASGRYFLMDTSGVDETCPIGDKVGDLLDWLWKDAVDNLR